MSEDCLVAEALEKIGDALLHGGEQCDRDVVGVLDDIARQAGRVAHAITPQDVAPGHDADGGTVASLTEAVMGVTGGLCQIAAAIETLAESVSELAGRECDDPREASNG